MNLNAARLDEAFSFASGNFKEQLLSESVKKRWARALEKARRRLIEQPFFAWQPERLLIVSVPTGNERQIDCRFYETNEFACRRIDTTGVCEAFFEGFPCWHRAAFLLLKIYFREKDAGDGGGKLSDAGKKSAFTALPAKSVNQS